ncbi:hypothetical protein GQ600_21614 [Phytophthora cactorum]|nr:hypothetical protein GQ600_21614 [Phytophthora cactorum]
MAAMTLVLLLLRYIYIDVIIDIALTIILNDAARPKPKDRPLWGARACDCDFFAWGATQPLRSFDEPYDSELRARIVYRAQTPQRADSRRASRPHCGIRPDWQLQHDLHPSFDMQLRSALFLAAVIVQVSSGNKSTSKTSKFNGWYSCSEYTFSGTGSSDAQTAECATYSAPLAILAARVGDQTVDIFVKRFGRCSKTATNVWLLQEDPVLPPTIDVDVALILDLLTCCLLFDVVESQMATLYTKLKGAANTARQHKQLRAALLRIIDLLKFLRVPKRWSVNTRPLVVLDHECAKDLVTLVPSSPRQDTIVYV